MSQDMMDQQLYLLFFPTFPSSHLRLSTITITLSFLRSLQDEQHVYCASLHSISAVMGDTPSYSMDFGTHLQRSFILLREIWIAIETMIMGIY